MKKKFLSITLSICLVVASMFMLTACGGQKFEKELIKIGETTFIYDGNSHICEINYEVKEINLTVTYSMEKTGEFKEAPEFSFVNVGTYNVYYKLSAEGYSDYISENPVEIKVLPSEFNQANVSLGSTNFVYDGEAHIYNVYYNGAQSATITYSTTKTGEFKTAGEFDFVNAGTYSLYFKVSVNNYVEYVSNQPVDFVIAPAPVLVSTMQELNNALTDNANENYIIKLNADFDLKTVNDNKTLKIESGNVILDLNGHTITGVDNAGEKNWFTIDVRGAQTELTIMDSSQDKSGEINGRCYGIQVSRGAKLTINGGNFVCTTNNTFNQSVAVLGGELVINNGNFVAKVDEIISINALNENDVDYQAKVTINGGKFTSIVPQSSDWALIYMYDDKNLGILQELTINGGVFENGNMQYTVGYCDSNIVFTNNASIPQDKIYEE